MEIALSYKQDKPVEAENVTFEHHRHGDSLGIGEARPRLSWRFSGDEADWKQESYELLITFDSNKRDGKKTEKFTAKIKSSDSVLVPWPCRSLQSRESATVQVKPAKSSGDSATPGWSVPSTVEVGLLNREDWEAEAIAAPRTLSTSGSLRPALFRKSFDLPAGIQSARLYITAYGLYEAFINGTRVGDHVLAPGWTSYKYHLNYQTFDVTKLLKKGGNAIGAEVGEGWYSGRIGYSGGRRFNYGDSLALLAQLEVVFDTRERIIIGTDKTWKSWVSPTIAGELYDGEAYDARSEIPGWSSTPFEDTNWSAVTELDHPFKRLRAPEGPPVRQIESVKAKETIRSPSGKVIVDFGQNLVGRLRVRASGPSGHTIVFHHVEVLENGEIATRPLRDCKATDSLTLAGSEIEWEPKFTFHGFRYVQVDNWPSASGEPPLIDIVAIVCHTDMERTGWFSCSDVGDKGVNKLHENIVWGMKGNFVGIPTDCPQRDERLGWTGDIQIFCPTANFLYDTSGMLSGWLKDLAVEQKYELNGVVGDVIPLLPNVTGLDGKAAWADAGIIVPWEFYNAFYDHQMLKTQLESMRAWLDTGLVRASSNPPGLWDPTQFQYGDWLDPDAPPEDAGGGKTDPQYVANAYLVHITNLLWRIHEILGSEVSQGDTLTYKADAARLKKLFQDEYMTPNGRLVPETMTSLSLAIEFDLLSSPDAPPDGPVDDAAKQRLDAAGLRLDAVVRSSGFKIGTGFVGTPLVLPALSRVSKTQLAYRMLHEDQCPSWLYPLTMGATTMWERWDSMLPDGSLNPGSMTSFNHYALGSVAAWLHSTVGGISAAKPGWKVVRIEPRPGGHITNATVKHLSPYGMIECQWEIADGVFKLAVLLPPNTSGEVKMPGEDQVRVIGSGRFQRSFPYQAPEYPSKKLD